MPRLAGKAGEVKAPDTVNGIKSWTLDQIVDAHEGTGFDSGGNKAYTPGLKGWSGSFEGFKNTKPLTIGTEIDLELKESATDTQKFTGKAIITGLHASAGVDGLVTYSYDFQGTDALTIPTT